VKEDNYLQLIDEGLRNWNKGNLKKAKSIFVKAKKIDSNFEIISFLGIIELQQNNFVLGILNLEESYSMNPRNELTINNLLSGYVNYGLKMIEEGKIQIGQELFFKAIKIKPTFAEANFNLGKVFFSIKDYKESLKFLNKAIGIKKDFSEAYNLIGLIYKNTNQVEKAISFFQTSVHYKPNNLDAKHNLGNCFAEINENRKAIKIYENLIKEDKKKYSFLYGEILFLKNSEYDWKGYESNLNLIEDLIKKTDTYFNNFCLLSFLDDISLLLKNARKTPKEIHSKISYSQKLQKDSDKIKIAYFSLDFKTHAVGRLVKNLFKNHDRKKFIIYGFSFARYADDNIYNEIKKTFDEFYDVSEKSDFSVLQIIKELNLDIAVDMMGYTKRSRSYLFDKRIAPTQVSFLGYLGTMGNTAYDYIVADKFTIPSNNEEYYDENVLRLPVYQPNNYKEISFKTVSKNSLGLPMNSFIYCCFNNPYKITPFIFDAWIKILQSTNNTYLYLIKSNNYSQENIKNYIFKKDLEPNRIIFTEKVSYDRYLSMLNACDVFLDTSPYNAGATAIDCLAVNTPIISLTGNSYVSRMCGSILNNLNQSDLIADNINDYINKAVMLSKNPKRNINLEKFKIFEISNFVRNFEEKLIDIHRHRIEPKKFKN